MFKKASIALVLASLVSTTALADGVHSPIPSASGGEDHLVLKARVGWLHTKDNGKKLGAEKNNTHNGYLGELALGYFFTDNIAVEGSAGYGKISHKSDYKLRVVPVSLLVQYHFMPEASVSPYAGIGYSYHFLTNVPKGIKMQNGGNVVGQVGLDIPYNDTMGFNIDVKYTHQVPHKVKVGGVKVGTIKINQTAVAAGVTFGF